MDPTARRPYTPSLAGSSRPADVSSAATQSSHASDARVSFDSRARGVLEGRIPADVPSYARYPADSVLQTPSHRQTSPPSSSYTDSRAAEEYRTAESIRRRREEISLSSPAFQPVKETPQRPVSADPSNLAAGSSRIVRDTDVAKERRFLDGPERVYSRGAPREGEVATDPRQRRQLDEMGLQHEDRGMADRHQVSIARRDVVESGIGAPPSGNYDPTIRSTADERPKQSSSTSKDEMTLRWLNAADGALGKANAFLERADKVSTPGYRTPSAPSVPSSALKRPISHASQTSVGATKTETEVDEEDAWDSDEAEQAERKAERFLSKASSVLTEDKVVAQDPRVLPSSNCRVFLRSFRGTYLRFVPGSTRAITGGTAYEPDSGEFILEKVSAAPSKILLFGDRVYIKNRYGWFLSGGDFTRDARGTWTLRRFVEGAEDGFSRPKRQHICSSDAVILEYDPTKRVLGVPSLPIDAEGSCYATLEVSPLDVSNRWQLVRSLGVATTYSKTEQGNTEIELAVSEDDTKVPFKEGQSRKPTSAARYIMDVCTGLYVPLNRLENELKASEDILLIDRLRPVVQSVRFLRAYVKSRMSQEWGAVCQALCGHLQENVLDPLDTFLAQFTSAESLTLLFSTLQPRGRIVLDWSRVLAPRSFLRGGALLNELNVARVGNFESRQVCEEAIELALVPYSRMLRKWLLRGIVEDPYAEFAIVENPLLAIADLSKHYNSRFWSSKFTLREEKSLPWFVRARAEAVLKAGRNAYAIVASGKSVQLPSSSVSDKDLINGSVIDSLHRSTSSQLLSILKESHLVERFAFMKRYFLLEHMDFFLHLMDVAGDDLRGPVKKGSASRLRVLLQVSMRERGSSFVDELSCVLLPFAIDSHVERIHSETEADAGVSSQFDTIESSVPVQLRCVDSFALDMHPGWPLSLVFSKRTMTKYQLLFRHLFRCKHAERRIAQSWAENAARRKDHSGEGRAEDVVAQSLVLRMMQFLQSLEYYTAFEVVEPRWREFEQKVNSGAAAQDVDELLRAHEDMLDTCLRECFLTNVSLVRGLSRLLRLCLSLGDLLLDPPEGVQVFCDPVRVSEFDQELTSFLATLDEEAQKGQIRTDQARNLSMRLDFSDFYGISA